MQKRFVFIAIICAAIIGASAYLSAEDKAGDVPFEQTKEWNKLDDRTQKAWQDAMQAGDTERRLDCFVRVRAPETGNESFLFSHGFIVRKWAGAIATGYMKAIDMPYVAQLYFVASIKLSGKSTLAQ